MFSINDEFIDSVINGETEKVLNFIFNEPNVDINCVNKVD